MSQEALDVAVRYEWLHRMIVTLQDVELDIQAGADDESGAGEFLRIASDHTSAARQALWPEYMATRKRAQALGLTLTRRVGR